MLFSMRFFLITNLATTLSIAVERYFINSHTLLIVILFIFTFITFIGAYKDKNAKDQLNKHQGIFMMTLNKLSELTEKQNKAIEEETQQVTDLVQQSTNKLKTKFNAITSLISNEEKTTEFEAKSPNQLLKDINHLIIEGTIELQFEDITQQRLKQITRYNQLVTEVNQAISNERVEVSMTAEIQIKEINDAIEFFSQKLAELKHNAPVSNTSTVTGHVEFF